MCSPQPEEDCLLVSLKLVDFIRVSLCAQHSLPPKSEVVVDDRLCLTVVHWVAEQHLNYQALNRRVMYIKF